MRGSLASPAASCEAAFSVDPPSSHVESAIISIGVLAAAASVGGVVATAAASKKSGKEKFAAASGGATAAVLATSAAGIGLAFFSRPWRQLGGWLGAIGIGGLAIALGLEGTAQAQTNPGLPPAPGSEGVTAEIVLSPGVQTVGVAAGARLTLLVPKGGALQSVAAPGLPATSVTGGWISLNVTGPGTVTLGWTDATGATQTTSVSVVSD